MKAGLIVRPWTEHPVSLMCASKNLAKDLWFWRQYTCFAIGTGSGLFVINNIGTMRQSLAGHVNPPAVQGLVISFALASFFGRLSIGWVSDTMRSRRHYFLASSLAILFITLLIAASFPFGSPHLIIVTMIGTGFGYGGTWASMSTIISEHYGLANFGKVYGLFCTSPAITSAIFNEVASLIYQSHLRGDSRDCFGSECYAGSMVLFGSLCAVAAVVTVVFG
eukprot:c11893_g1_i5.p1 GENE.c11893_g1_i5~~c11893_g1_i5.p1  ORF type:complete len:222 (-),score=33.01 c11893_g1_i5:249-914(-)